MRGVCGPRSSVEKPPKGSPPRPERCRSSSSCLRVTGNCASAAREFTAFGSTPARIWAKAGACCWACATCCGSAAINCASRCAGSRVSNASKNSLIIFSSGQPALAPLVTLDIAEALALAPAHAQVELLDVLVRRQFGGGPVHDDPPAFHDV